MIQTEEPDEFDMKEINRFSVKVVVIALLIGVVAGIVIFTF